jgi:hypothetical protein
MVRDQEFKDIQEIRAIHAKNDLGFELPDFRRKLVVSKVFTDNDRVVMAAMLRPTTEAYIICDKDWRTPWFRWQVLQELHGMVLEECREQGIEDTQACLDPNVERAFGRRLLQCGWRRHIGALYSRKAFELHEVVNG